MLEIFSNKFLELFSKDILFEALGSISGTTIDEKNRKEKESERVHQNIHGTGSAATSRELSSSPFKFDESDVLNNQTIYTRGVLTRKCHDLRDWQKNVIRALTNKNDIYLVAPPGAGKTMPIFCYFVHQLLGLGSIIGYDLNMTSHNRKHLNYNEIRFIMCSILSALNITNSNTYSKICSSINSKIIIAVPIRKLVDEYYENFFEIYGDIISSGLKFLSYHYVDMGDPAQNTPSYNLKISLRNTIYFILVSLVGNDRVNNYIHLKQNLYKRFLINNQGNRINPNNLTPQDKHRYVAELTRINNDFNKIVDSSIRNRNNRNNVIGRLISIQSGVDNEPVTNNTRVIISIYNVLNRNSIVNFIDKNLNLFFIDESHNLHLDVVNPQKDYKQLINDVDVVNKTIDIVKRNISNCRVVFATGTLSSKTAIKFRKHYESTFKNKMILIGATERDEDIAIRNDDGTPLSNQSNINVHVDNNISNFNYVVNLISNPKGKFNLIIVLDQKKIKKLCEFAVTKSSKGHPSDIRSNIKNTKQDTRDRYNTYIEGTPESDWFNPLSVPDVREASKYSADIKNITDPELRNYVLHGFGYILRNKENPNDKKADLDSKIVARLFSEGKIHTIIATTAVGVGVNLKVRKLYIEDALIGTKGIFSNQIGIAELSQLLNRTGRSDFKESYIVTTSKGLEKIKRALAATIDTFPERLVVV
jgi:hypothetical protein